MFISFCSLSIYDLSRLEIKITKYELKVNKYVVGGIYFISLSFIDYNDEMRMEGQCTSFLSKTMRGNSTLCWYV